MQRSSITFHLFSICTIYKYVQCQKLYNYDDINALLRQLQTGLDKSFQLENNSSKCIEMQHQEVYEAL